MKRLSLDVPLALAIALGATTPSATTGARVYSSTTTCDLQFDGTQWVLPQTARPYLISKSAAYTFVIADQNTLYLHPAADTTARTWTIPANSSVAFPIGTTLTIVNQNAAGVITLAITTDTMRLAGAGTTGSRTIAANAVVTAIKITATEWIVSGVGLT